MPQLERLSIGLPHSCIDMFAHEPATADLLFPSVHELHIGDYCGFVVNACPNVRAIKSLQYQQGGSETSTLDFLKYIGNAPRLERFTRTDFWTTEFREGRPLKPTQRTI